MLFTKKTWQNKGETGATRLNAAAFNDLETRIDNAFNLIYPVGAIYLSVNSTSPATLFGGTWEEIQGKFLLGRSSSHAAGSSGGAENVTLAISQIPSHTHGFDGSRNFIRYVDSGGNMGASSGSSLFGQGLNLKNTGGNESHNNMPPFLAIYIWKRIA